LTNLLKSGIVYRLWLIRHCINILFEGDIDMEIDTSALPKTHAIHLEQRIDDLLISTREALDNSRKELTEEQISTVNEMIRFALSEIEFEGLDSEIDTTFVVVEIFPDSFTKSIQSGTYKYLFDNKFVPVRDPKPAVETLCAKYNLFTMDSSTLPSYELFEEEITELRNKYSTAHKELVDAQMKQIAASIVVTLEEAVFTVGNENPDVVKTSVTVKIETDSFEKPLQRETIQYLLDEGFYLITAKTWAKEFPF